MIKSLKITQLLSNEGQIKGLPRNPRLIKDARFEKLKKSLTDDPEMLELRELLVVPFNNKYVIIGGNMRFRAAQELGFTEMPCKVIPANTPVEKLRAYVIKDNLAFGSDDVDLLKTEWDTIELESWGFEVPDWEENKEEETPDPPKAISTKLLVECADLLKMQALFDELQKRGFQCKLN